MATETITQIQQPPEFIEAAAKPYLTTLQQAVGDFKDADLSKVYGPQFVAGQDPLSAQAISVATAQDGLGSFRPFLQTAATIPLPFDAAKAIPSLASFSALISNTDPAIP